MASTSKRHHQRAHRIGERTQFDLKRKVTPNLRREASFASQRKQQGMTFNLFFIDVSDSVLLPATLFCSNDFKSQWANGVLRNSSSLAA
jgi:hypothetical protein